MGCFSSESKQSKSLFSGISKPIEKSVKVLLFT